MVSVSTGAMDTLLQKLTEKLKAVESQTDARAEEITELQRVLSVLSELSRRINSCLADHASMLQEPSAEAKRWMGQVREMVYDVDDWIDSSEVNNHAINGCLQLMRKVGVGLTDDTPNKIKEFRKRLENIEGRHESYGLERTSSSAPASGTLPGGTTPTISGFTESQQPTLEDTGLVGIDGPTNELLGQPKHRNGETLKISSIVGPGGLGKTTLAKQVYRKVNPQQFKCRAFVHAGRNPSVRTTLKNILNQVGPKQDGIESWDERQLIDELRKFLTDKGYFIVIDNVQSLALWWIIRYALPDNKYGSWVIITTRFRDVARSCCAAQGPQGDDHVYEMKPLGDVHSRELLHGRIFGTAQCPRELEGVSDNILKCCDGAPLAIIVIAGLLASKKPEVNALDWWNMVHDTVSSAEDEEAMGKILHLGYTDLPDYLKSCFLYLSVFPEYCVIREDRLIRRWIAEGFFRRRDGENCLKDGENCLKELIKRGLIQPGSTGNDEEEVGFAVHDMIHELITSLSVEENFVTVPAGRCIPRKIRRLSLHYGNHEVFPTVSSARVLSHVRSLTIFGYHEVILDSSLFQFLRVLDLEDADKLEHSHIRNIGMLLQLKYLGLGGEGIRKIPEQFGKMKCLETLEITRTKISKLSATTLPLKLVHLLVANAELPGGMQKMEHLEELRMVNISKSTSAKFMAELGRLNNLKMLGIKWCFDDREERCIISKDGFRQLEEFWFRQHDGGLTGLVFKEDAMPNLRKLRLQCRAKSLDSNFKFDSNHLRKLKQVYVKIDCQGADDSKVQTAEVDIRSAVKNCELQFSRYREDMM